jgi:copper chaperone CopZ
MRKRLALWMLSAVLGCAAVSSAAAEAPAPAGKEATATLRIDDRASQKEVGRALRGVRGVKDVEFRSRSAWVRVKYDPSVAEPRDLVKAVERVGYPAVLIR